ncbi:MAG: hypothetical protein HY801_01655 [Candidatus Lindowbacteria bacterium]|nr:hypothetical protein [Candidatus Lindowbacteria bacterium]
MEAGSLNGWLVVVLHMHIPFVANADPMAEEWLYQAAAESYIPLLNIMNRLVAGGKSPKLTIGITPTLTEQLGSEKFRESFPGYLRRKMELALSDAFAFRNENMEMSFRARQWEEYYWSILYAYEHFFNCDLLDAFRRMQDSGHIEILASAATHAFMPLLSRPSSIRAQIGTGAETYERCFGRRPAGFWLPECAYRPGIEDYLADEGIRGQERRTCAAFCRQGFRHTRKKLSVCRQAGRNRRRLRCGAFRTLVVRRSRMALFGHGKSARESNNVRRHGVGVYRSGASRPGPAPRGIIVERYRHAR